MLAHSNLLDSSSEEEEEDLINQTHRQKKIYRDRVNFDFFLDSVFIERFRLSRSAVQVVLNAIGRQIDHISHMNFALNPKEQILVALHFFGNGSQYHSIGDMHGIHKSTVCRIVNRVAWTIVRVLFPMYVRWPNYRAHIPVGFSQIANFPRVAGVIDGTLIPIKAPHSNENDFVDRHGMHSLNAMVVCGTSHEFFYASARWPGSVHDNRVLRNSSLFQKWENEGWRPFPNAILLGDSGYQNLSWLLTPNIPGDLPANGERRYLRRLRSTRQMVECSIGILKAKFPCLNYLRLKTPEKCCRVILACITLHNIQIITESKSTAYDRMEVNQYIEQDFTSGDDVLADIVAQFEAEVED